MSWAGLPGPLHELGGVEGCASRSEKPAARHRGAQSKEKPREEARSERAQASVVAAIHGSAYARCRKTKKSRNQETEKSKKARKSKNTKIKN